MKKVELHTTAKNRLGKGKALLHGSQLRQYAQNAAWNRLGH